MEDNLPNTSHNPETLTLDSCFSRVCDWEIIDLHKSSSQSPKEDEFTGVCNRDSSDKDDEASFESMLCLSGSRLVPAGLMHRNCTNEILMFVNAGGEALKCPMSGMNINSDCYFEGGDVLRTEERIFNGGDCPSVYQSARFGSFSYRFNNLAPGYYFVDLHFAEIVNTNGPKGMRVFNVFVQEEKVLSELDIYSVVGANRPLQMVDARVSVAENGEMVIRFEGINGSPSVCGICIRKSPKLLAPLVKSEYLVCNNCAAEIEVSSTQNMPRSRRSITKYEKKIQELAGQCQLKTDECYEAWMSLTAANENLEKLRMDLDNKTFQAESLDQALERQATKLRDVSDRYLRDKKFWVAAINDLEGKIKSLQQEHSKLSCEAHECADSIPEISKMIYAVQALVLQCEKLKVKYSEEQAMRKKFYNQVQETKGNIRVFCRCRPLSKVEVSSGYGTVVDFDAAKDGDLGVLTGGSTKKSFKFDRVYTPKDDQVDVFADASPLVVSVLDGYNVCIFAYGQTGTGKTFTMEGTEQNRGVNYRTVEELFKIAKERKETFSYNISVSVLEVYNEQIRDLLATSPTSKRLEVRQAAEGVHHVPGIVEAKVENIKEVWDVLQAGSNARAVESNNVNEHSSRSHCMLCIMVKTKNLMSGECTKSKLWLVDLAGSERLSKTDAQGERLKEAQNINRSLSALGDVISSLATKSSHIPYRNSKLTHLLQDSLGGDSKTLMFVQISPSEHDLGETLSSLNFATRVRGIELGPAKKQIDTAEVQKTKTMLDKARQESRFKDDSLRKLEETCQNFESKVRSKDQLCRNQQEKIKELESQLESNMEFQQQSERQLLQVSEKLKGREEMCMTLQQKVKELENRIREQEYLESAIIQQKVKELENRLKEQQHTESTILQQKVKELENKLTDQLESMVRVHHFADQSEGKGLSRDESMGEIDPQILRCSNSVNRPMNQGSLLLRGTDSLQEIRRKRVSGSGSVGDPENNIIVSTSLPEKKILPSDWNRPRQIDSGKALSRLTRTSKAVSNPKIFPYTRSNKEQIGGIKERAINPRVWSR